MIENLRLYQIPWSHYCEKVRWALDFKEIPYEVINYSIFGKTNGLERAPKSMPKLMPIIEDPNSQDTNQFRYDSTPILLYLDDKYSRSSKVLFPTSSAELRQRVIDTCLRLDSELGLYARRIAYVEILNEKSSVISILLGEKFSWAYNPDDIRSRLIGPFIACFMISRYRLHRIREDHLKEKTERLLLEIGDHLRTHNYLVGEQFSAADLTLSSLIKPLQRVLCFSDDPRFRIIFEYHQRIRQQYDPKYPNIDNFVEKLVDQHRARVEENKNRLTTRIKTFVHRINFLQQFFIYFITMAVSKVYGVSSDEHETLEFQPSHDGYHKQQQALNDQRKPNVMSVWLIIPFVFKHLCHLIFTIPEQAAYLNRKT